MVELKATQIVLVGLPFSAMLALAAPGLLRLLARSQDRTGLDLLLVDRTHGRRRDLPDEVDVSATGVNVANLLGGLPLSAPLAWPSAWNGALVSGSGWGWASG